MVGVPINVVMAVAVAVDLTHLFLHQTIRKAHLMVVVVQVVLILVTLVCLLYKALEVAEAALLVIMVVKVVLG
tara:strand:- start:36 stop:254 length:219 start_codon:yes stop_codon:yes gene_type:complete